MSNTYFQFKSFRIGQERCAMKVCTDACVQGALAGKEVLLKRPDTALDIGTGTGVLSLMLAQNHGFSRLDAVEINQNAFEQAGKNFKSAAFNHSISLFHEDIRSFQPGYLYDFIICNPPFYQDVLESPSLAKKQAMHSLHLNRTALLQCIKRLLHPSGFFCLLHPFHAKDQWIQEVAQSGFRPYQIFHISYQKNKSPFRSVIFYKNNPGGVTEKEIIIRENSGIYETAFENLLRPYYLYL